MTEKDAIMDLFIMISKVPPLQKTKITVPIISDDDGQIVRSTNRPA